MLTFKFQDNFKINLNILKVKDNYSLITDIKVQILDYFVWHIHINFKFNINLQILCKSLLIDHLVLQNLINFITFFVNILAKT